jgi:hypothetical protein
MGGVFQAVGGVQEGKAQYVQLEAQDETSKIAQRDVGLQVKQIELGATQREADRKEALNKALASQNAMTGASGITAMGSPGTIQSADIQAEEKATQRDRFMTDLEKRTMTYNSILQRKFDKMAKKTGQFSAFHKTVSSVGQGVGSMMGGSGG